MKCWRVLPLRDHCQQRSPALESVAVARPLQLHPLRLKRATSRTNATPRKCSTGRVQGKKGKVPGKKGKVHGKTGKSSELFPVLHFAFYEMSS